MPACPACGRSNPAAARFCMSCASPLPVNGPGPHGARKTVTVVFCDVAGSTALAERLDPESMRAVMSRFFRGMQSVLERHGGTVEKFIGDAVMAVFGVPLLHEDDALRAVRAAAGMRDTLAGLNADLERRWGVKLQTRMGVNTGEVVVGDPAAGEALVVGDAVNLAARLEEAAPADEILLGRQTFALVRDHVQVEQTEALKVKGKQSPVVAYRLVTVEGGPLSVGGRPDPPLVDREAELATIWSAFRRSVETRGCTLLTIVGSAGVGKSRLAREFEVGVDPRALVVRARCLPYGDGITFWPIAELVKKACKITTLDSLDEARKKIDGLLQGSDDAEMIAERVAAVTGIAPVTTGLHETFWAIRRFLEWYGRDQPLVAIIDDLQWAEPTFLDLVEYLAGSSRDTALVLLCLARPELTEVRPTWGAGTPDRRSLPLAPLNDDQSAELIAKILDGAPLDAGITERIAESAGGNPLFLEEMLRMLEDDGLLRRGKEGRTTIGNLSNVSVPPSIHALLSARLDRLSGEEREVIRSASVVGKVFWWGAVEELTPKAVRPYVGSHLQTLVRKDLIRPDRSTFAGEDAFRFHHILIQEAAYRGTPKEIRAKLHERFAAWVERAAGERAIEYEEVIGYHLEQAHYYWAELGATDASASLAVRGGSRLAAAGRRAFARGDMSGAADLLSRAAALFPDEHEERRALLPDLGESLSERGDLARADVVLAEAAALAERAGDPGARAQAIIVGFLVLESTDPKRTSEHAVSQVEQLIPVLERLGDHLGLARAHRLLGDMHWTRARYGAAQASFERSIKHARLAGALWEEAEALGGTLGSGVYGPEPAKDVARRCEEILAGGGVGTVEARALRALASVRAMQGQFDEARNLATRARSILEELGMRMRAAFVSLTLGSIEMLARNHEAAEREYRIGYETAAELREQGFLSTIAAELAHALIERGKLDDAEVLTKVSEDVGAQDDAATQVTWRSARAQVLSARRDSSTAAALACDAVALAEKTDDLNMQADTLVALGEVLRAAGRSEDAAVAFMRALKRYRAKGNVVGAEDASRRRSSLDAAV